MKAANNQYSSFADAALCCYLKGGGLPCVCDTHRSNSSGLLLPQLGVFCGNFYDVASSL